jgi:hypothetical protein
MKPYITVGWVFIHGKFHFVSADKYLMRYHEIIAENAGTLTLWHGGRDLESSYHEVRSHAKGRWEHGPGLYLTTHYDTAAKYAKGGGKLYKVTVRKGTDISEVEISFNDAMDFVNSNVKGSKRKQMETDLANNMSRRNAKSIPAEVMINLCLNCEAIPNTKTNVLRQFLIDQGVDYAWVNRYGGRNESVMVVINPKIITRVQVVPAKDVKDGFELPNTFQESLNEKQEEN